MLSRILTGLFLCFATPTVMAQDPAGSASSRPLKAVRAVRTQGPIVMDGLFDEPDWLRAQPATDFVQQNPREGQPVTEDTQVRVLFDDEALYFAVYAFDREPAKILINTLERDFSPTDSDGVCIYLDTFNDDRNGYNFCFNPAGARQERQYVNEGRDINTAWEDVWDVKPRITGEGWFAEVRIPFRSVRFANSESPVWGINFQRRIRRRFEQSFWSPLARRHPVTAVSQAGDLLGLEGLHSERMFRLKPFVTAELRKLASDDTDSSGDVGLDLKYGVTPGLSLDATANTDFSQVEVDDQQINLTRFNLFFPEKREFFLENSGIFAFGQTDQFLTGGGGVREQELIPFFSRRIGLSASGNPIPILGGIRLSGHEGKYSVGVLNMQTRRAGSEPARNFSVFRVKRDILAYSEIGVLFVDRESADGGVSNRTWGVDGSFRFFQNLRISSFLAGTRTPGLRGDDLAGRLWAEWRTNFWEARTGYLDIGRNFNAEVGFVPRTDMRKIDSSIGIRPRPRRSRWIREFFPNARLQYIMDHQNRLVTRSGELTFHVDFQDGASVEAGRLLNFERLDEPFVIHRPTLVPGGDHHFNQWFAEARSNPSKRVSGFIHYEWGDFWNGSRTGWQVNMTLRPNYRFSLTTRYTREEVSLRTGAFQTELYNLRINYAFSTAMFLNALVQYNTDLRKVSTNLRLRIVHRPLSDIFVVYNEQRDAFQRGVADKSLSVKYTHALNWF